MREWAMAVTDSPPCSFLVGVKLSAYTCAAVVPAAEGCGVPTRTPWPLGGRKEESSGMECSAQDCRARDGAGFRPSHAGEQHWRKGRKEKRFHHDHQDHPKMAERGRC